MVNKITNPPSQKDLIDKVNEVIDAKQDTLVSGTNIKSINNQSVLGSGNLSVTAQAAWGSVTGTLSDQADLQNALDNKASTSLDNLSPAGQMVVDSQNGTLSNCILEIPQRFTLEIKDDWLSLLPHSKLWVPAGSFSYAETATTTYPADYNSHTSGSKFNKYVVFFWKSGVGCIFIPIENVYSSATEPEISNTSVVYFWFNTDECKMYKTLGDGTSEWIDATGWSAPVAIVQYVNSKMQFAKDSNGNDMIFNGACLIGHHAVVYPNVSGLRAVGKNDDGSLASDKVTTTALRIVNISYANRTLGICLNSSGTALLSNEYAYYDKQNNIFYRNATDTASYLPIISFTTNSDTTVTDFTIRQPVRLATTEMLGNVKFQVVSALPSSPNSSVFYFIKE